MILRKAPLRRIGHWQPYYFSNSKNGLSLTSRRKIKWHDLDFGLSKDGKWRIGHGNPERVILPSGRMKDYTAERLNQLVHRGYRSGRPRPLFRYAKKLGLSIEIEPKGYDNRYLQLKHWRRLARSAEKVWGKDWQKHTYVKVGPINGKKYATDVIATASKAGFTAGPTRKWLVTRRKL